MKRVTPPITLASAQPRRLFLRNGLLGMATLMAEPLILGCSSEETKPDNGPGTGPSLRSNLSAIGPLGPADGNGLHLPEGFSSRIVARTGEPPVPGKDYVWHIFPDGGATYETDGGGWIYVSNSEMLVPSGGVGALRFDASGELVDAYSILTGSNINCAGGKTQWGTWLSCEEVGNGRVFECDVTGASPALARPALGIFKHEAVALDPVNQHLYLSEDEGDGRFYRFVPDAKNGQGFADLTSGRLEVAEVGADGKVTWHVLSDPQFTGSVPTRLQVASSTVFDGGEGLAYHGGVVYLSTKGDNRVWAYHVETQIMSVLYEAPASNPILSGVDNLTVTCCGDVLVAEDGDDMQVVAILADGTLKPLLQVEGHAGSEITGPAFDPSGTRLYFSSQRSPGTNGLTFEVEGPFHLPA